MVEAEEYFPRGGTKPTTTYFKQSENFLGAAEKGEKKKKRTKKKSEDDDGYLSDDFIQEVDQSYKTCGIFLNYKVVKEGLLMLGRVRQVFETKLHISLPCRMNGVVMACHISESYNKLLEAYVNDKVEIVRELSQIFRPGQYVAVKVLEVCENLLTLTMMPQHINCDRKPSDLHKGALFQAAVSSVEDHGFVMDIGIPNTRAFLAKNDANQEVELDLGVLTWVTIKSLSPDNNVINLSSNLDRLQKAFQRNTGGAMYPGTAVNFSVHKALDNGIEGYVFDDQLAYIQRNQVDIVKGKKPALGQKIRARLLYSVPPNHIPFFTMRGVFDTVYPDLAIEQIHQEGDIIVDAKVLKTLGRSVLLRLSPGATGALIPQRRTPLGQLADDRELDKAYPIGSSHKVRVLCYCLADYLYSVSDDPSVLAQSHFTLSQVSVGELLSGTVAEVHDTHLRVTVGRLSAYVPQAHMTETGIFIDPKKARTSKLSQKYKVGQAVRGRVLQTDGGLLVSLKPSLLDTELAMLTRYSLDDVGKMFTGVVAHIKQYLLVSFFNGVCCYVPARLTGTEPGDLADAFHVGQIVKCTIMAVKPEAKKMTGSLITPAFVPFEDKKKKKATKRKNGDKEVISKKKKLAESNDQEVNVEGLNISNKVNDETQSEKTDHKKKKKKQRDESKIVEDIDDLKDNITSMDTEITQDSKRKNSKKNKTFEIIKDIDNPEQKKDVERKKKKKDKKAQSEKAASENDEIEIDIQDDSETLTPQELSLTDLSDCVTEKHYKKRVVSLLKAIKARNNRITRVEKKIAVIEEKGLTPMNKKFHTAMHLDKLTNEERIKKLMDALTEAQNQLKQFGDKTSSKVESKEEKTETLTEKINEKPKENKKKQNQKKEQDKEMKMTPLANLEPVLKLPSAKDFWSLGEKNEDVKDDSSSSDEEEQEKPKKKRKKLSVAEKVAKAREEEERLREMERRAIESESSPRSSEQFERALLAQPDCSQLWIAYMAFHLQSTEIEKARGVARKALATIAFREEGEKLNVWLALLNIEHRFGTKETQQKTLQDALQMNDPYKVHSKLLDILVETSQHQELVALVELMMRKYRRQLQVYTDCGAACYSAGLMEKARQVMQKGIAALEKKEHVTLLVRFSSLERMQGSEGRERSEALLEHALAAYPQRLDVCCLYADMLLRDKDIARARQLMERMTSQNLPARKMKVLYKKWIEVEQKIGDEQHAESVRQLALKFLDKAKF